MSTPKLQARDAAIKKWLHGEVAQSYDEYVANPSAAIPGGAVLARIRATYKAQHAKRKK